MPAECFERQNVLLKKRRKFFLLAGLALAGSV
jgi:hypothetical protein